MVDTLLWFRRDLRWLDNPALACASQLSTGGIVAVVVVNPVQIEDESRSIEQRRAFLSAVLNFQVDMARRQIPIHLLYGPPEEVIPAAADALMVSQVVFARDVTPFAKRRDAAVVKTLQRFAVRVHVVEERTITCFETVVPSAAKGEQRRAYQKFTPFYNRFLMVQKRPLCRVSPVISRLFGSLPNDALQAYRLQWTKLPKALQILRRGACSQFSERVALMQFGKFMRTKVGDYAATRDMLIDGGTSQLSFAYRSGLLSARWVEGVLGAFEIAGHEVSDYRRQLAWRDFYYHLMDANPSSATHPIRTSMQNVNYPASTETIRAFFTGQTGFPLIDAAMRALLQTGCMHNRLRMLVASFATKQLGINWREGERHFACHLIDYDHPLNVGGWQWSASVGTDAQPFFRTFDPVRQGKLHDPDGIFIKKFIPELASLPLRDIHAPWCAPPLVLQRSGVQLGDTYPFPVVELKEARAAAIARYQLQ